MNIPIDYTKGGHGKKAPYQTEMFRIPKIMKPEVQRVSALVKELYAIGGEDKAALFLLELSSSIDEAERRTRAATGDANSLLEPDLSEASATPQQDKLALVVGVVNFYRQRVKNTRNWVEASRLINDLLGILL